MIASIKKKVKIFGAIGVAFGFALGYLYAIGGLFHDLFLTGINQGTYLALNALWGMPLLIGLLGALMGVLICILQKAFYR